jgi:hypothetical protein
MAQVNGHSDLIHLLHRRDPRSAQAGIARFETAIAKSRAHVVGELHNAHAEIAEHLNAFGVLLQKRGVLEAWNDADLVLALSTRDIRVSENDGEGIWIFLH